MGDTPEAKSRASTVTISRDQWEKLLSTLTLMRTELNQADALVNSVLTSLDLIRKGDFG
jgi:hypothetical protein